VNEIDEFGLQTMNAIARLVEANCYLQALVILYSAIDTLAWANISSGNVTRSDFCRWVDMYLMPQTQVGCTSEDIYGARCSLVHSGSAESRMSREGRVSELWYATAPNSINRLELYALKLGAKAKVIYFTALVAAFAEGVMKFSQEIASQPEREATSIKRIKQWLRFLPTGSLDVQG
jgi:hypothetical protein